MLGQEWWKTRHDPKFGFRNYSQIIRDLTLEQVKTFVNVVSAHDMLSDSIDGLVCSPVDKVQVYNSSVSQQIVVNGKPIGTTTIPTELVKVTYDGRECFIQIFYDEGSQISLCNRYCAPLVFYSRKSEKPIRIGSVNGETNEIRPIESVYLGTEHQMEGVLVPNLALNTATIMRPNCLSQYDNMWAVQLGCHHGS